MPMLLPPHLPASDRIEEDWPARGSGVTRDRSEVTELCLSLTDVNKEDRLTALGQVQRAVGLSSKEPFSQDKEQGKRGNVTAMGGRQSPGRTAWSLARRDQCWTNSIILGLGTSYHTYHITLEIPNFKTIHVACTCTATILTTNGSDGILYHRTLPSSGTLEGITGHRENGLARCSGGHSFQVPVMPSDLPSDKKRRQRSDYPFFLTYRTRWSDNDQYAHINNAIYYQLFDAVVNTYLIQYCGLAPTQPDSNANQIGLVVSSFCEFFSPLSFPDVLDLGLRVIRLGNSSVTYEVGVFKSSGEEETLSTSRNGDTPSAVGGYTHVFVDKRSRTSVVINGQMRLGLEKLTTGVTRLRNGGKL